MSAPARVSPSPSGGLSERIVLVFLCAAAAVLGWIYFRVMPEKRLPEPEPFDVRNPLLLARPGACVAIESTSQPGVVVCARVRDEGVVLRPRRGPERLGIYRGLLRSRPYVACSLRYPPPGTSCAEASGGREDLELFDLNGFGMPYGIEMGVERLRPLWVQRGGRQLYVYEVQLTQYGPSAGRAWSVYLDPGAPVLGTVLRRQGTDRGEVHETIFTSVPSCP
jgi:hypothetical protein